MLAQGQQKKLVEEYKHTNKQLRKQLNNLNDEIDRIINIKSNKIGIKKLPNVDKNIQKTTDARMLQHQVDNLRKRLQQLHRDSEHVKERSKVNHMERAKELQQVLADRRKERQAIKKEAHWLQKNSKKLNTTDSVNEEMKLYERIEQVNQELIRARKHEQDLKKELEFKKQIESRKMQVMSTTLEHHQEKSKQTEAVLRSRIEPPVTHGRYNDEEWTNLKRQFLELKQSKMRQEKVLTDENDRLRTEVRALELRLKQRKFKMENIRSLQMRRQKNYSTVEPRPQQNVRYRNRNNSYKYNNTRN